MDKSSSTPPLGGQQSDSFTLWEFGSPDAPNIPIMLTPLIGRGEEFSEVKALLDDPQIRLVSITGPGGIGKTHLAISLATSMTGAFRDGVCFIPCEPYPSADLLPEAINLALNLPYTAGADRLTQLLNFLRGKEICLIFDNLEHLLPHCLPLLVETLEKSPSVKILATSIERLALPGEYTYRLSGLAFPQGAEDARFDQHGALALFADQLSQAGYRLKTADLPAAIRICQRLDGMPLALLLAAGWVRVLSIAEIEQALDQGQELAELNGRSVQAKHSSIRAVFDRSWDLLSENEQRAARRLAVFKGDFDLACAESVAGAGLALLASLVDKSIIRRKESGFSIHGFLRKYLEEKLAESGEQHEVCDQFLKHYCAFAEQAEPELVGHTAVAWLAKVDSQINNLRAALQWGIEEGLRAQSLARFEHGVRLAQALWYYWHLRYTWQEGWRWYTACLQGPLGQLPAMLQVRAYAYGAIFESMVGDWDNAMRLVEQSLALARQHDLPEGLALALLRKGGVWRRRNPHQSSEYFLKSLDLYRRIDATFYVSLALFYLSQENEDRPEEQQYLSECLKLSLKIGNKRYAALALINLGGGACYRGDYGESISCHEQAAALFHEIKDAGGMFIANRALGNHALHEKSFTQAAQFYENCHQIAEKIGDQALMCEAYILSGFLKRAADEFELAEENFKQAVQINRALNLDRITILANYGSGWAAAGQNNFQGAFWNYRRALDCFQRSPNEIAMFDWVHLLDSYACTLAASGQLEPAVLLFSAVEALFVSSGYILYPLNQEDHDRWLPLVRKKLEAAAYARAWRGGRLCLRLPPAQAMRRCASSFISAPRRQPLTG